MRTALISDIHGNAVAFDAALADLARRPVDQVVCLGDVVQGGPEPTRALELLDALDAVTVLGNADAFVLDVANANESQERVTQRQLEQREWTLAQLSPEQIAVISSWPPRLDVDVGGGRTLVACHGSPGSYDDVILPSTPEDEFRALLAGVDADLVAGGHVHTQFLRRLKSMLFVNPGSVGLSYDHEQDFDDFRADPWAAYAVIQTDNNTLSIEFRRVRLDVDAVVAASLASGMPHADVSRWATA